MMTGLIQNSSFGEVEIGQKAVQKVLSKIFVTKDHFKNRIRGRDCINLPFIPIFHIYITSIPLNLQSIFQSLRQIRYSPSVHRRNLQMQPQSRHLQGFSPGDLPSHHQRTLGFLRIKRVCGSDLLSIKHLSLWAQTRGIPEN
jgi:hypothetical protein